MANTNNYYQLYLNSVLDLAKTIVIKSIESVEGMNTGVNEAAMLGQASPVNALDPRSWKYYLNVSGQYHETDTMMTVTSMDSLTIINFTKENLKIHRATAKGYQYGTRAYLELVSRYPDQESLILGILYPCDIDTAIAADDATILSYPPQLVEANEYSLIPKLQAWISGYKERWVNKQYNINNPLYPAVYHGHMYLFLVTEILNARLEACKTNEAHSYHVRSYLASHQGLDQYLDLMTTDQALFFYRNIAYIERNTGSRANFDWLVEHIMTVRNLPLAEYDMVHDITEMPDQIKPTITFVRRDLNSGGNVDSASVLTLSQMLDKEQKAARQNGAIQGDVEPQILEMMEYSRSSSLKTKALESAMVDYSDSTPYTLSDIQMNHWLWLASQNRYNVFISATNPKTGERLPLSAKDAWVVMWYCYLGSVGIDLSNQEINPFFAKRVQRIPPPSIDELMSVVNAKYIDRSLAIQALSLQPVIASVTSIESFYDLCVEITAAANFQRNLIAYQEHKDARGYAMGMVERIYSDNIVRLAPEGTSYKEWFAERNLVLSDFTEDEKGLLYLDIVKQATGQSLINTNSLANLQAAMVKMISQLSSYSVQFLSQINTSKIQKVDWPAIRVGDVAGEGYGIVQIPNNNVRVRHERGYGQGLIEHDLGCPGFREDFSASGYQQERLEIATRPMMGDHSMTWVYELHSAIDTKLAHPIPMEDDGIFPMPGVDLWRALPDDAKYWFMDVWGNDNYYWIRPHNQALTQVVANNNLNGLVYTE